MSKWSFCEVSTLEFADEIEVSASIISFHDLLILEKCDEIHSFQAERVLDLDSAEEIVSEKLNRNLSKSMDCGFCIKNQENLKIVLVELKCDVDSPNSMQVKYLEEKVEGSTNIVNGSLPIYHHYFFVFKKHRIHEATQKFRRYNFTSPYRYWPVDIETVYNAFFEIVDTAAI